MSTVFHRFVSFFFSDRGSVCSTLICFGRPSAFVRNVINKCNNNNNDNLNLHSAFQNTHLVASVTRLNALMFDRPVRDDTLVNDVLLLSLTASTLP